MSEQVSGHLKGEVIGFVVFLATAVPFAALAPIGGIGWAVAITLYGMCCMIIGFAIGLAREGAA